MMNTKRQRIWLNDEQKELYAAVAKNILKGILVGAMLAIALTSPYLIRNMLKTYNRHRKYKVDEDDLEKVVEKIKKDRLVTIVRKNGRDYLKITGRGRRQLIEYNIDTVMIKKQPWDGNWRIVIFDIPEKMRVARRVLRDKLKQIGFIKLQKSVWICPYECQDEIEFIASVYEVEKFVNYAVVSKIDSAKYLKSKFNLK